MKIRIGTRKSPLALFQAEKVSKILTANNFENEIISSDSDGDLTEKPLHEIGGKGVFISKLERNLEKLEVDIAVHSLKDVPSQIENNFIICGVLDREDPSDIFISKKISNLDELANNTFEIGTSSPRRASQLLEKYPETRVKPIRGNIETRIDKLKNEQFDGIIMAKAAINRLNLDLTEFNVFEIDFMIPAASQGYIGIECLSSNNKIIKIFKNLTCNKDLAIANAERNFVASMDGECLSPISILIKEIEKNNLLIKAKVSCLDGSVSIYSEETSDYTNLDDQISKLSQYFIENNAKEIIRR